MKRAEDENAFLLRLPSVVILENIHSQGSKIIQILAKLEVTTFLLRIVTTMTMTLSHVIQGCLEEAPFILCTSNPTEYISDLAQVNNCTSIYLVKRMVLAKVPTST